MTRVQLPEGCYGLDMADGRKYTSAKPGGQVEVSGQDAHFIDTSFYGQKQAGIMRGGPQFTIGTKAGRWCLPCKRLWQAWSEMCPRCGQATIVEYASAPNGVPGPRPEG